MCNPENFQNDISLKISEKAEEIKKVFEYIYYSYFRHFRKEAGATFFYYISLGQVRKTVVTQKKKT